MVSKRMGAVTCNLTMSILCNIELTMFLLGKVNPQIKRRSPYSFWYRLLSDVHNTFHLPVDAYNGWRKSLNTNNNGVADAIVRPLNFQRVTWNEVSTFILNVQIYLDKENLWNHLIQILIIAQNLSLWNTNSYFVCKREMLLPKETFVREDFCPRWLLSNFFHGDICRGETIAWGDFCLRGLLSKGTFVLGNIWIYSNIEKTICSDL